MPAWLTISTWFILVIWSMVEIAKLYAVFTEGYVYNTKEEFIVVAWGVCLILWFTYQILG